MKYLLSKKQCELMLALWLRGHKNGVGAPQPIMPDKMHSYKCNLDGKDVFIDIGASPLSDLIDMGYVRVYDELAGSILFTPLAEKEKNEIISRFMSIR